MANLIPDLRFAVRTLRRSPLFATVAILSLGLGIGANTAIFTLLDQIMLRLLPIRDPEQLVMLIQKGPHNGSNMGDRMHSYPIYQDYQTKVEAFSEVLCRRIAATSIAVDGQTERVQAEMVSGNYFTMLGVKPMLGRVFSSSEDDQVFRGHPSVVLSYDYWMSRFAGDRNVIGKKILVNNYPMNIVGVSAAGFTGIDPAFQPQLRVPILMEPLVMPEWTWVNMSDRRSRWVQVFARLKPGYTPQTALAPLRVMYHQNREYEASLPAAKDWTAYSRERFIAGTIEIEPAATGYSQLRQQFSKALLVLMAMVGLVLLIACANLANLLIARAFARQKEIAVRLSIGASRGQLVRQLMIESLVLSLAGGVVGIFLSVALTRGLLALMPSGENPLLIRPEPDLRILTFTLALTCVTAVLFGLLPAVRASRPDLWTTLKDAMGSIAGQGGSLFLRKGLVAAQVALSFLLLFGAGLFVRSLQNLQATATGFKDVDNLVSFQVQPALNGYDDQRGTQFYRDLLDRLRSAPGVKSAGLASVPVLSGDEWDSSMSVEGHQVKDGEDMQAFMNAPSPGYFATMGVALIEGRDFRESDAAEKTRVVIVNRQFAEHFFPGQSAIGRHVGWGVGPKTKLDMEIVGVTENSLYEGPRQGVRRQAFVPNWGKQGAAVYVRTSIGSQQAYQIVRNEIRNLDPNLPVFELKTVGSQLDQTLLTERLIALLSAGFGLLATILAAIGLYGVMAFVVTRRTKELGVRMALGAMPSSVVWLVMREVLILLSIGLIIGVPAAIGLGQLVATQLYGVKASDPSIAALTVITLAVVATLAGLVPAQRASRIDPILALRYE